MPCTFPEHSICLSGGVLPAVLSGTQFLEEIVMFLTVAKLDIKDPGGSDDILVTVYFFSTKKNDDRSDSVLEI